MPSKSIPYHYNFQMVFSSSSFFTIFSVLLTTIVFLLYKLSRRNFSYWKERNVVCPGPVPFAGNFLPVFLQKEQVGLYLKRLYDSFRSERYFGIYMFNNPCLIITDLELAQKIFIKDFNNFSDHMVLSDEKLDYVSSKMLFFAKNPLWRKIRVKLSPVFSTGKVCRYFF